MLDLRPTQIRLRLRPGQVGGVVGGEVSWGNLSLGKLSSIRLWYVSTVIVGRGYPQDRLGRGHVCGQFSEHLQGGQTRNTPTIFTTSQVTKSQYSRSSLSALSTECKRWPRKTRYHSVIGSTIKKSIFLINRYRLSIDTD